MRRLRVQLTVLLALLGMLVLAWGAAIFLAAGDAARSSTSIQSTVDRVDELRRAATGLSRDLVAMETSRRAYLLTGDQASFEAGIRAHVRADEGFKRVKALSERWRNLPPLVQQVAAEYRAWVRTGQTELRVRRQGRGRPPWSRPSAGPTAISRSSASSRRGSRTSWPGPSTAMPATRTGPMRPPRPWPCGPP
jgi:CHASE3 domain sensor protein